MRTAVVGVGSLGTIIGALITKNGGQIDMIDSYKPTVDALREKGATVTGAMEFNVPVSALTPDEMEGVYDLFILTTKQTALHTVLPQLMPHMDENTLVLTLQNGIPEELVASYVGKERTAGGAVGWGATWLEPGVSRLTSTMKVMENFAFEIGEIDGSDTPRIREAQKVLNLVGHTEVLDNLMGIRWAKVLMNATFSGMSAAMADTFGAVLNDETTLRCIAHIADETIRVANACGVRLAIMQGTDFETLKLDSPADIPPKFPTYHKVWDQHSALKASMLQDLEKGRPTEIDFINGIVCRKGDEHGIDTPYNDKVVELVKLEESTGVLHTMKNKEEFLPLLAADEQ
ncbi:ketopantoate reductase family protein [Flavonifractor sp. HCP28S3_F3]|uniref:ketopantoate reductase family protein n=1 Tax=Flavonifractor sp. HCP28S3_F3 TaxID=3438939 RepID=UPI003F8ACB0B